MTDQTGSTDRTAFTRKPDRGSHDLAEARAVLAEALIGHIGTVDATGAPIVLPVAVARSRRRPCSLPRLDRGGDVPALAAGAPACLTVTQLDGLVIARSAFESSMNYRSVVVLGACEVLDGAAKDAALRVITDHLTPGRWEAARPLRPSEVAATLVLALPLVEFSVKVPRRRAQDDEDARLADLGRSVPVTMVAGTPVPAAGSGSHPAPQIPGILRGSAR